MGRRADVIHAVRRLFDVMNGESSRIWFGSVPHTSRLIYSIRPGPSPNHTAFILRWFFLERVCVCVRVCVQQVLSLTRLHLLREALKVLALTILLNSIHFTLFIL